MHYGYSENKDKLKNRLNRIEGQVRGVAGMVESDKYCIDILTQITAVQAALDKVGLELLRDHAKHCLTNPNVGSGSIDEKTDELVTAVSRMIKR
jgi:DNA-binding FrmR family transcriptional regulator